MRVIIAVTGPTCSGKSTVIKAMAEMDQKVYPVQIGKELRKRHPEETFDGEAACCRMREEKWATWDDLIAKAPDDAIVVVDGMPRAPGEMEEYVKRNIVLSTIVMLDAPEHVRNARSLGRRDGRAGLDLSLFESRCLKDYESSWRGVTAYMMAFGNDYFVELLGFDTSLAVADDIAGTVLDTVMQNRLEER